MRTSGLWAAPEGMVAAPVRYATRFAGCGPEEEVDAG